MRKITLGVYDYRGNKLIDLYHSDGRFQGAAYDIEIKHELNGNKELKFALAARLMSADGCWIENPRWPYMRNEYMIRLTDSDEPEEWDDYFVREPVENRSDHTLEVEVSCEHVSKRLAQKNLFLELSSDGNGVGTAKELLERILDGTGWHIGRIDNFKEADGGTEKVRTLTAGKKTGSYRMITQLAELFGAFPVFHGRSRTVDLLTEVGADLGVEFRYAKNLESVQRTCNSDQLCTRLYVDYLESERGYIGIERVNPLGTSFVLNFSYMERLGLVTPEQQAYMSGYTAALKQNAEAIRPSIALLTEQENAINSLIGQCGVASMTVQTLGDGQYQWQKVNLYNLPRNFVIPVGAEIYCLGEHLNWEPYVISQYDATTQIISFAQPTQVAITRMIWFEKPPSGTFGALMITLGAKQKVLSNLTAKYESETDDGKRNFYYKHIEDTLADITSLYSDNDKQLGIASSFAYLLEVIPALEQTQQSINNLHAAQDTLTAEFETIMGDLIKDGVYDGRDYSSGQEHVLYQDAVATLDERCYPEVEYDCDAVVLSEAAGYEIEAVHIGDQVRLIDQELGIDDTGYITELIFCPDSHEPPKVSIGNYLKHYTDFYSQMILTTQQFQDGKHIYERAGIIQSDGTIDSDALEESLRGSTFNAGIKDCVHLGDDGVVVTNPLDPNGSQLKIADGALYVSKDGGLTWALVMDGSGISPDMLSHGVLDSGKLTIMDGDSKAFLWNSTGLYALHPQYPDTHWIRFSKDGIAFTQDGGETYDFQICWDGVLFRRNGVYMSIDAIINEITVSVSNAISAAMQQVTPDKIVSIVRTSQEYQLDQQEKASQTDVQTLASQVTQTASETTAMFNRIGLAGGQTGIVRADIDGVTVSMQDGEQIIGSSRLGAEGLTIYDANGDARADFGSGDKAWIKRLITEDLDCPSIVKSYTGSETLNLFVAPTPTGDGSGKDQSNLSNGIKNALKSALGDAKHIPYGTDIRIHVCAGAYNEQIIMTGFFGGGSIHVLMESADVILYSAAPHILAGNEVQITFQRSGLKASDVEKADQLKGNAQMIVSQTGSSIFLVDACRYVHISGIRTKQSSGKYNQCFVSASNSSRVSIDLCDISNCDYLAKTTSCAYVSTHRCCGSLRTGWMFADDGGQLCRAVAPFCPALIGSSDIPEFFFSYGAYYPVGGFPAGESAFSIEASRYNPDGASSGGGTSSPIEQVVSTTIYASEYTSTRKNGAEIKNGICYQGNYFDASGKPYPKYTGYARFYGISDWCSGASNISMRLYVQRLQTAHGKGSGAHPCLLLPNGAEWSWHVGLARNGNSTTSTWIELPDILVNYLANGGGTLGETLTFYASSTDDYIQFQTNMILEITATKAL